MTLDNDFKIEMLSTTSIEYKIKDCYDNDFKIEMI